MPGPYNWVIAGDRVYCIKKSKGNSGTREGE